MNDKAQALQARINRPRWAPRSVGRGLMLALLLMCGYYLLGMAAMSLQSPQSGVTPIWPASGLAFAICYWAGLRYSLAILPAMLLLALSLHIPWQVGLLAGTGSILEVVVPIYLLRRLRFDARLQHVRDVMLFVALGAVLGPLFSAGLGTIGLGLAGGETALSLQVVAGLWWLGNSIGVLVFGGFLLLLPVWRSLLSQIRSWWILLAGLIFACGLVWVAWLQPTLLQASLVLYLMVPTVIGMAMIGAHVGVLSAVMASLLLLLGLSVPAQQAAMPLSINLYYLNIALLWVTTLAGLAVGSAFFERDIRKRISWMAHHDPLTRLLNRHAFNGRLAKALESAVMQHGQHALVVLDLDHFKQVNDIEGHAAGDRLLQDIARLLMQEVRNRDAVARLGGDEFAVLLEHCPLLEACGVAENIRRAIERYEYQGEQGEYSVEASIGIAEIHGHSGNVLTVMQQADAACYEAKRAGRNRVWVDDSSLAQDPAAS